MKLPILQQGNTRREVTDLFLGYNHNPKIQDGEMYDDVNMTTDYYPLMASRRPRGLKTTLTRPGGLIEKDALCYVANGTLYVNGIATAVTGLTNFEKQLVSMGAYILIFPDKVYYNTADPSDFGSMEADYSSQGDVTFDPCNIDGEVYDISAVGPTEPQNPTNGQVWIDTSDGYIFYQWSVTQATWVTIPTVYTKITFTSQGDIPRQFRQFDGVTISGCESEELNGSKVIYALGGEANQTADYIVVIGLMTEHSTMEQGTVRVERKLPQMDFVCECQNRLWGCFYGNDGEQNLNEIYGSALGDFRNFRSYQGLATDSWTASVGSDGQWTGAVNYLGHPVFFKENRIHVVTVSSAGAHQIDETVGRGVQKGSHKSLQVVGETLYYKSRTDICAWQGGFPEGVSAALGEKRYYNAVAGAFGDKYVVSMEDEDEAWSLFVLDTKKGLWMREDDTHAMSLCKVDDELWCLCADGRLLALNGTDGESEGPVSWEMETGILYYAYPDHKYVSRYDVRLTMEQGAAARIWMEYDSSGEWIPSGRVQQRGTGTVVVPVRPRRCDHLRMRLTGTGAVKVYSIARTLEVGSDV